MLTTIKGIYSNGQIILKENPAINKVVDVLVTFIQEDTITSSFNQVLDKSSASKRKFGFSKGIVSYISPDFDAPLDDLKDYQ